MANGLEQPTILDRIVAQRRESVAHRKRALPEVALKIAVKEQRPALDFASTLARDGCNIIAELKKASPSLGLIRDSYNPAELASAIEAAGAAALSVLTEEDFFLGSLSDLKAARRSATIPILRKDFIFDPWQVWEARAEGADSFLLIAAVLTDGLLNELIGLGRELGMEPLVEVHSHEELARASKAGARIIGVNNRDLRDFQVTLQTSLDLIPEIAENVVAISESGLHTRDDLERLRMAGFDAFLIGERFMKQRDPAAALRQMLAAPATAFGSD